ncbi:hypothetical protein [Edaphobacter sp. DSM 109919]|uniref:Uncharacterized protein n=1 Tax=Edaphobacter paludis TaxID=3035702 RepID=A0AAU7CXE2_9BACT
MHRVLVLTLLSTFLVLPQGQKHATFEADGLGRIDVTSSFPVGGFPTANFRNSSGRVLYSVPMGSTDPEIFRIEQRSPDDPPEWSNLGPSKIVYFVLGSKAQQRSVLAIAQYTGGSDCEYVPALVGSAGGRLKSWLQQEPVVNSQGGFYVGDLGGHRGFGLAAWTDLWEDGAHYGSHRYNIRLYRIDPGTGTSSLIFKADTKRKYGKGLDALKEFGFQYENFLTKSPALGC